MAQKHCWQDPIGLETIKAIIAKVLPTWTDGLRPVQLELVSAILDTRDVLCITATGDGKSAAFSVPFLVLLEYANHPDLYATGLPSRKCPIGVVITPTKGLADNLVYEVSKLGISAFSYCKETLSAARKSGVRLAEIIKGCTKWKVICIDPEHLRDKEWREITEFPTFRENILFACIDEVHLINEWGLSFRPAFAAIGSFIRGRFPTTVSVVGLTATLEPGLATTSVCKSLGFFDGNFLLIRRTNERPNTQFSIQFLTHGLNGDKFPDLLPYLSCGRKTIIHCRTVNQVSQVYAYIWRLQPIGSNRLLRARVYHSICPSEYNKETITLLETEPRLQIVISTVAFSNGLNAKSLLDSLSLGFGSTFNESWQEKGRVGRDPSTIGRGIIFAHRHIIKDAESFLASSTVVSQHSSRLKKKGKVLQDFDRSKALIITETHCYIARINACYGNTSSGPLNVCSLDCFAAHRSLPCSLCTARYGTQVPVLLFPPSLVPIGTPALPPLIAQPAPSGSRVRPPTVSKKDKLTKKERAIAEEHLHKFGESIYQSIRGSSTNKYLPRSSCFPSRILSLVVDALLVLHSRVDLACILGNSWAYFASHGDTLLIFIADIRTRILEDRINAKTLASIKRREKQQVKGPAMIIQTALQPPTPAANSTTATQKRPALDDTTNTVTSKRRRATRSAQPSVAETLQEYRPQYRVAPVVQAPANVEGLRRSARFQKNL